MAVYETAAPPLVEEIIRALGATGDEIVPAGKNETAPLRQALLHNYTITTPTPRFLKAIVERASAAPLLKELLQPDHKHDLQVYLWGMEVIDFLLQHPSAKFTPEEFLGLLTKLQPRLYSVASCLRVYPESVHFIVDVIRYESHGRLRKGVASTLLAERCNDQPVPVFPSVAKHFHLPEGDADIIMVGPGTGIVFFFQAEDGIRDYKVTGVQTCALPISNLATSRVSWVDSAIGIVVGGGIFWAILEGSLLLTGREGMGGGDVKLGAMLGAFLDRKSVG